MKTFQFHTFKTCVHIAYPYLDLKRACAIHANVYRINITSADARDRHPIKYVTKLFVEMNENKKLVQFTEFFNKSVDLYTYLGLHLLDF